MNKETLRNIRKIIVSPEMAVGVGLASVVGADLLNINLPENRPSLSSKIKIEQARIEQVRKEMLVFDTSVRDLEIVAGKTPADIVGISTADKIPGVAESINLVRQEETISQQGQKELKGKYKYSMRSYKDVEPIVGIGHGIALLAQIIALRRIFPFADVRKTKIKKISFDGGFRDLP